MTTMIARILLSFICIAAAVSVSSRTECLLSSKWMSLSGGGDTEQQQQQRRRRRGFICVGGSSGMGKAAALECLRHDGHVLLISRSIEKLEAAKRELIDCIQHDTATTTRTTNDIAERIRIMSLDVTDETAIQEFVATEIQKYKESPDHHPCYDTLVISAAGKAAHGPVRTLSTSATREMLETKLWTAYHCSKYMSDLLLLLNKEHMHDSSIVFVGGILNRRPGVNCVPLAVANGALEGLCRSLALEFAPLHIRVNCLSPGFCDTERFDHMDPAKKQAMLAHTASSLPLQRVGQPCDMGHAIFFLATNEFTTGVVLDVDGGHLIRQYASSADTDPMRKK